MNSFGFAINDLSKNFICDHQNKQSNREIDFGESIFPINQDNLRSRILAKDLELDCPNFHFFKKIRLWNTEKSMAIQPPQGTQNLS